MAAGNMPAKGELGVPENHEKARPDLARRAGGQEVRAKKSVASWKKTGATEF